MEESYSGLVAVCSFRSFGSRCSGIFISGFQEFVAGFYDDILQALELF